MRNSVLGMGLMVFALSCQPADSRFTEPPQTSETLQENYSPPPPVNVEAKQMPLKASRPVNREGAPYQVLEMADAPDPG